MLRMAYFFHSQPAGVAFAEGQVVLFTGRWNYVVCLVCGWLYQCERSGGVAWCVLSGIFPWDSRFNQNSWYISVLEF